MVIFASKKMRKLKNSELNRKTTDEARSSEKTPFIIVLDNVRSENNVGSVFRTADAFLVTAVFLCGITGKPPSREIQKTALGATESVAWKYFGKTSDGIKLLKEEGYRIICVEQAEGSVALQDFNVSIDEKYALVFGHEVNGVSQDILDMSDGCIEIPQFGMKHSFNIAVSAGIVLWEVSRKIKVKG